MKNFGPTRFRRLPGSNQYAARYVRYGRYSKTTVTPGRALRLAKKRKPSAEKNMITWLSIYGALIALVFLGKVGVEYTSNKVHSYFTTVNAQTIISPIPDDKPETKKPIPTPTPDVKKEAVESVLASAKEAPEKEEIVAYVKKVFGKHADKAFIVLSCENSALNPEAANNAGNYPSDSYDLGLFQINSHWQKIENRAFLFDYKINTMLAWSIFERDGYSFKLWTCGRKFGV